MGAFGRLLARTVDVTTVIGAIAVALMMFHITADVVAKFVFNAPLPGTIPIVSDYYMIIVSFLPLAFAERRNGHISVEVLVERLPGQVQWKLSRFSLLFSAVVFGLLAWRGITEAERARDIGAFIVEQDVKIVIWPARYLLPVGAGLMVVVLLFKFALGLSREDRPNSPEPLF